ncbi:MAG: hypothetical protein Q4D32_03480 [Eubacteriales bacterium]|nr:hypothetical protein [Eubacteriales bacterium]
MKSNYIPKVVTLLAGAVVCVISIVRHMDVTYSLEILLATLIIFYILGVIAQKIVMWVERSNRFIQQQRDKELEEEKKAEQLAKEQQAEDGSDESVQAEQI